MPRKIIATVDSAKNCPIFKVGDKMSFALPEILTGETDGICGIAVADLLPWVIKPSDEGTGQETVLATLAYGECFGEMSLLTGDPVTATIRARGPVRALEIRKDDFDGLLSRNPVLNSYFSKLLALRLKKTARRRFASALSTYEIYRPRR